jgi:hypothetical protein
MAIRMKRRKSAGFSPCRANPSARLAQIDLLARADLVRARPLLDSGQAETAPMDSQRDPIRPLEHLEVFYG